MQFCWIEENSEKLVLMLVMILMRVILEYHFNY